MHEAALEYLTHRSSSVAQLRKVLARRIAAWARRARAFDVGTSAANTDEPDGDVGRGGTEGLEARLENAKAAGEAVIARLLSSGLLDDAAFAQRRAEALTRAGKSRRAVAFDLAKRGIGEAIAREATPSDGETELAAAVALMRKKRLGPYSREESPDDKLRQRWLGAFARGGFSFSIAQRALRLDRDAADELLRQLV